MNATAVEDLERGLVVEAEVVLWNLVQHGPPELQADAFREHQRIRTFREGRWVAKCDKCHSPIIKHPGGVECDRAPGAYPGE